MDPHTDSDKFKSGLEIRTTLILLDKSRFASGPSVDPTVSPLRIRTEYYMHDFP